MSKISRRVRERLSTIAAFKYDMQPDKNEILRSNNKRISDIIKVDENALQYPLLNYRK